MPDQPAESPSVDDDRTLVQCDPPSTSAVGAPAAFPFLAPPQRADELGRLGDYRVLKKLGEGANGFVFRAEDTALRRFVALKVMRPEVAEHPQAAEYFLREGRALAGLKSDHVVTIYQVAVANGVPFLMMEFLEGVPLDAWMKAQAGPVPLAQALHVVRDTLRGLAAAHEKGLIHRDIKPANLWIETGTSRIKILDFGLTRSENVTRDLRLTADGAVVGTPSYMAPEQAAGKNVDVRADLFSVGTVCYHLLAGTNPFARGEVLETLKAVCFEAALPIGSVRPDVPAEYAAFLDRLHAKKPADRPADARAALDELAAIEKKLDDQARTAPTLALGSLPVVAVPAPAAPPARDDLTDRIDGLRSGRQAPPRAARALLLGGGAVAFLMVAAGTAFFLTQKAETPPTDVKKDDKGEPKKPEPKKPLGYPDRAAAEFALSRGGAVTVNGSVIVDVRTLPAAPFQVTQIILDSYNSKITDADLELFHELTGLRALSVNGPITDAGLAGLAKFPFAASLTTLNLTSLAATDDGLAAALASFPNLHGFSAVSCPRLTGSFLAAMKDKPVKTLYLSRLPIQEVELRHLKAMPQLLDLVVLVAGLTDAGLETIGDLPRLRTLNLGGNPKLTDAGAKHLENLTELRTIYFEGVPFQKAGFASLAKLPHLLMVGAHIVPDRGDDDVAPLASSATLDRVSFLGTAVTNGTLEAFAACKTLKWFELNQTKVTADGVAKFKAARPDVTLKSDFDPK